jgi:hypothetical protein
LDIPQGLSRTQFNDLSQAVRAKAKDLGLGDDIFVQGSRAGGTAKSTSESTGTVTVWDSLKPFKIRWLFQMAAISQQRLNGECPRIRF